MRTLLAVGCPILAASIDAGAQIGPANAMPSDFNFIFQYGHGRILDTSKGTFTRDAAVPKYSLTVDFKLMVIEMEDIYRGLISIDFWNYSKYPQLFTVPPERPIVGVVPGGTDYLLRVTSSGSVKQLRWHDSILVYYQPAQELRELFGKIRSTIESKPEYKNLPPSQVKYVD